MLVEVAALILATLFTGSATYISLVEHPVRLRLDQSEALTQWKLSYERALPQAGLAVLGGCAGLVAWRLAGSWACLIGGILLLANCLFTIWGIMPTNKLLKAAPAHEPGLATSTLMRRWGRLHDVRSALGASAVLFYACGIITQ